MPVATDLHFPPDDSEIEVQSIPNAELRVIPSIWGHWAGGRDRNPVDALLLETALREILAS